MPTLKVGFIGLGRMGLPMSYRLLAAGFDLMVHNRSQGKVRQIAEAGARPAASAAQIVCDTDIVLACLPDVATVGEVFLGENGIVANARPGQVLVDHSTVGLDESRTCAAAAGEKGATFLDAPISGGEGGAAAGTLSIMVGGETSDFNAASPLLHAMGKNIFYFGDIGMRKRSLVDYNCM